MKAVVLVGGLGTRLRPLTCNLPKPMLPILGIPFIEILITQLRDQGVDEVILAVQYLAESFQALVGDGKKFGIPVRIVEEPEPRGTAGAVRQVAHLLDGPTFVLNGDVLTDLDLRAMREYHHATGSMVTISLIEVEDPSAYGVVDIDRHGRIHRFVEKPRREDAPSRMVNAGTYICEPEIFELVPPDTFWMFERGLFPDLLAKGQPIHGYNAPAYWTDIGTPQTYLQVHHDILNKHVAFPQGGIDPTASIHQQAQISGPVCIGPGAQVAADARIVGPAMIGAGCVIEAGATVSGAVLWRGVHVGVGAQVYDSVLGEGVVVEAGAVVRGGSMVGDGCRIGPGNLLDRGIKLWPGMLLPEGAIRF